MSDFAWPSDSDTAFLPGRLEIMQFHNNRASASPLSGYTQSLSVPGMRWGFLLELAEKHVVEAQRVEAFLSDLNGMEHRVGLYDLARPLPLGTINTSGVTASAAAQFATTMTLNGCGNTKTLKAGDWFSVVTALGAQLCMNMLDATSNAGGVMTVARFKPGLRAAVSGGAAVVVDKPRAYCINASTQFSFPRLEGFKTGSMQLQFIERFQA